MPPEEAITYGMELLHAADRAERGAAAAARRATKAKKPKAKSKSGDGDQAEDVSFGEKIEILRSAGRWYVFWGKRGHPIQAWY